MTQKTDPETQAVLDRVKERVLAEISTQCDLAEVTRICLQTDLGRYEFWADSWQPTVQDDGRTLHLRGRGEGTFAKTQRDLALAADLTDAPSASPEDQE